MGCCKLDYRGKRILFKKCIFKKFLNRSYSVIKLDIVSYSIF